MNDILFRGLDYNNEWHYGYLIMPNITTSHAFIVVSADWEEIDYGYIETAGHRVKPETVGQYTGLKDKNLDMIFAGDMFERNNHIGVVTWVYDGWYILFDDAKLIPLFDNLRWDWFLHEKEKIGNMYENSELLNESLMKTLGYQRNI